jgi:hypothetical protein
MGIELVRLIHRRLHEAEAAAEGGGVIAGEGVVGGVDALVAVQVVGGVQAGGVEEAGLVLADRGGVEGVDNGGVRFSCRRVGDAAPPPDSPPDSPPVSPPLLASSPVSAMRLPK